MRKFHVVACALAVLSVIAGCASEPEISPHDLLALHKEYMKDAVASLRDCIADPPAPSDSDSLPSGIYRICMCVVEYDGENPAGYLVSLLIDEEGRIINVEDSGSGRDQTFGTCENSSIVGLAMPKPPGQTIFTFRLNELFMKKGEAPGGQDAP